MEDNLLVGDHLLVNKFAFGSRGSLADVLLPFRDIQRGDVIVFKYPGDLSKHYVKRAIGLPGDRLTIVDKQVLINGQPLREPYKFHKSPPGSYADPLRDFFPPRPQLGLRYRAVDEDPGWYEAYTKDNEIVVPADHYFAMGDNRDNSSDSRYWGFVSRDYIVGKALVIYWSFETDSEEYRRTGVDDRVSQVTDLVVNFFRKTRWSRTLQVIR